MLDYFCIFTKGGAILWTFQVAALKGNPIEALIRTCLLEDRSGEKSFTYTPKDGAAYALKWRLHNRFVRLNSFQFVLRKGQAKELGLVFVAVYQRALSLMYVDELLDCVLAKFTGDGRYVPQKFNYSAFNDDFRQLLLQCENRAAERSRAPRPTKAQGKSGGSARKHEGVKVGEKTGSADDDEDDAGLEAGDDPEGDAPPGEGAAENGSAEGEDTMEERLKKLKLGRRGGRRSDGKALGNKEDVKKEDGKKPKKTMRNWNSLLNGSDGEEKPQKLNFSSDLHKDAHEEKVSVAMPSGMDVANNVEELPELLDEEEEEEDSAVSKGGFLSSMVRTLKVSVVGGEALTHQDIEPALEALKKKLVERNVGHEIATNIADSVAASLEGKKLASFTRISKVVYSAVEESLTRILTPARSIDILREVQANQAKPGNRPYVITFVGVNGVGKSTNLAKVAYWLIQHNMKVMIAACDTFRSGAVEQLRTHCQRLGVSLYERGYEKDPAKVAFEGIKQAERERADVLLVDTAGRMQDNEPLMKALAHLISLNRPELVLFVGEALVGNEALDQISKFNQRLTDLADANDKRTRAIDGIVLTKFDTIDDKVGAAISMVYTSRAPVMFVGCGQTYVDLKRLNVKEIVNVLLS